MIKKILPNDCGRAVRDANGNKRALTLHQQQMAVHGGPETQYSWFLLLSEDTDAAVV
jgi:hypothetical protein